MWVCASGSTYSVDYTTPLVVYTSVRSSTFSIPRACWGGESYGHGGSVGGGRASRYEWPAIWGTLCTTLGYSCKYGV